MARKKRWEYATVADFIAAGFLGGLSVTTLTYEQYFGLSLNISRVSGRHTFSVFQALCASRADKLPPSFFEPVSSSRKEAEDRSFDYNAVLAFQRAVAGMKK